MFRFHICAAEDGKDSCQGDSGGPLFASENGRWSHSAYGLITRKYLQLAPYFLRIRMHVLNRLGCINLQNLCGHHQEEVLRFPKHPQLAKFGWFLAKLLQFKEKKVFLNLFDIWFWKGSICTTLFLAVFLAKTHPIFASVGCSGILKISSWWWAQRF